MLLNKHELENGDVHVAAGGTTALGIIGTVLGGYAVANQMGNGNLLGGVFGGGNMNATKYDLAQAERIGALESTIAALTADKNTDAKMLDLYNYVVRSNKEQVASTTALFNETFKQIGDLKTAEQVNKMEIDKNFQLINQKVDYENKLTACQINALRCYVDATFMPVVKRIAITDICPLPQAASTQPTTNG